MLIIGDILGSGGGTPIVQPPSLLGLDPYDFASLPVEVTAAARPEEAVKIPVYIPAFTDCELGLDFGLYNIRQKIHKKPT